MISFFGKYFSFSDVQFAGDGAAFFSLEYIYIRKIIIAVVIVSFLVSLLAAFLVPKSRYAWWRILASVVMIALSVTGISRITANITKGAFLSWDNYMRKDAIYENFTDTNECMMLTGLYQYTFRDFFLSYGIQYRFFDFNDTVSALDAYYAGAEVDPDNEMTGAFVGKNLILIQLEAIDTWMINDICMPTLTSIQENSLDFTNYYAPMYLAAGTFNTENIVNTGLVSPFTGALNSIYTRNYYPFSLAHLMRSAGYSANSFHSQRGQVYDRETIHLNWGYETFYSGAAMGMADLELDSDMMSGYDLMVSPDHNFLTFIVTYSGHGAYLDSEVSRMYYDKFAELLPADTNEMVIYAYAHAYETDLFIKALMERLEDNPDQLLRGNRAPAVK